MLQLKMQVSTTLLLLLAMSQLPYRLLTQTSTLTDLVCRAILLYSLANTTYANINNIILSDNWSVLL